MPGRSRQALRTRALAVVLAAIGLVLAGCAETNEVRTQASSDGLRAELGGLLLSNLMVLAAGEGKPGPVLGAVQPRGRDGYRVDRGGGRDTGRDVRGRRGSDGATTRRVPILDATLDCYRGLVPSPSSN